MSLSRIFAVFRQEIFLTLRSLEVIVDLVFFSFINIVVFGFVSLWLAGGRNMLNAYYLLAGMIWWQVVYINQYSVSVGSLWNIWSRNLSNMFVSPLTIREYLTAHMLSGLIKTVFVFAMAGVLSAVVFDFNIFAMGAVNLFFHFLNLTLFAWSLGIIILGFIFKFGTRIQALAWSAASLFQPLSAAFYPVKVLPPALQSVSAFLPSTYVFEAVRGSLTNPVINWNLIGIALFQNAIYFAIAMWSFRMLFNSSKRTGQFARNEG